MSTTSMATKDIGFSVQIVQDMDAESPREWDNLGEMICFHRRYELGDKHSYPSMEDVQESIVKGDIVLPLYLYDHSGITMRTDTAMFRAMDSQSWDWGCTGVIVARAEKIRSEWGVKRISPKIRQRVIDNLEAEVDTYDKFLTGDTWGYTIESEDGTVLDSCFGFYGHEDAEQEAARALAYFQ